MMAEPHDSDSPITPEPSRVESRTEFDMTPPPVPSVKRPMAKSVTPNLDFLRPGEAPGEIGRLGGYRIQKVIGTGGMGVVFQAEDPSLKRLVALKVMKPFLAVHDNARKRFTREAQSAAAINHDHVVHIYQVSEDQGVPFLAMELLEGESLDVVLRREKQLSLAEVLRISREVAAGLSAAHRRGVIHRDVKPANIVLVPLEPTVQVERALTDGSDFVIPATKGQTDSGSTISPSVGSSRAADMWLTRVKIVDFGLARATDGDEELTQSGQVTGTPQYMSPEQIEGHDVDPRSDLFSLGCVIYRMLCGETPFSGRSSSALLLAIAERPHKPLREHWPNVPAPVEAVVNRLLAKNPSDRFQSALELIQTLAELERQLGAGQLLDETPPTSEVIPADSPSSTTSLTVPDLQQLPEVAELVRVRSEVSRLRRRNFLRSRSLVTAVCGVLLLVGLAVGWRRMHSSPPAEGVLRERPGVARQAESVKPDAALLKTTELPALQERWGSAQSDSTENNPSEPSVPKDYALSFDGKDSYVRIGQLAYRGDSDLTVECRVTPLSKAFSSVFGNNEQGGVGLGISTTGSWAFFVGQQQEGTNPYAIAQATEPVKLGEEVYLAAVFDRRTVKLFVNGKLQATTEWKGPFKASDLPFWIGADPCPEAAKTSPLYRAFHGLVDELRVSSAAKYSKDFEPASRLEKDSSTLLLYHFDEGPGPKVYDHSGHHRFGDNRGAKWQHRGSELFTVTPTSPMKTSATSSQDQAMIERSAAEWALRIGGTVKLSFPDGTVRPISAEKDLPKESFAVETLDVHSNPRVTDDDVRKFVSGLRELKSLQIHHTPITDAALGAVRDSHSLYSLHLESTKISDQGVEMLGTLPNLIHLQLNLTQVTEACLPLVLSQPALVGLNIGSLPASQTAAEKLFANSRWRGLGLHESWIQPEHVTRLAQLPEFFSLVICGDLPVERLRLLGALPELQRLVFFGHQRWTPELSANLKVLPMLDTLEMWSVKPSTGWAELATARPWKSLFLFATHVDDEFFDGLDRADSLNSLKLDQTTQSRSRLQRFRADHPRIDVISNTSRSRDREVAERLLRLGGIEIETVDKRGVRSVRRVEDLPDSEFMLSAIYVHDCQAFGDRMLASLIGLEDLRRLIFINSSVTDAGLTALDQLPKLNSLSLVERQLTPRGLQTVARQSRLEYLHLAACDVVSLRMLADLQHLWHLGIDKIDSAYTSDVLSVLAAQFPNLTSVGYLTLNAETAEGLLRLPKLKKLVGPATTLAPEVVPVLSRHPTLRGMDLYGFTPQPWGNLGSLLRIQEVHVGVGTLDEQKVSHLAELPQLQTLTFDRLEFTSEALAQMAKLRHVRRIQFKGCNLSDSEWARLTEMLPNSQLPQKREPPTH